MQGLVLKSTGSWYTVKMSDGSYLDCRVKGKLRMEKFKTTNPIAVGDIVDVEFEDGTSNGVIVSFQPRKNYIIRRSTNLSKQAHVIAANIDHAYIVATIANPRTSMGFIDRFLITAEAYQIPVSIIFNKIDSYTEDEKRMLDEAIAVYQNIGYMCYAISVKDEIGIDVFKKMLYGKVNLLSGHSGVGKSSLINLLDKKFNLKIGAISNAHSKGTHTTTFSELLEADGNTYFIDTPGIKEFGVFDMQKEELAHFFPEFRLLFNKCKYSSCLHISEPACAVKTSVENGSIAQSRYETYLNIITGDELVKGYEE